jgi:hypothetical protein
MVLHTTRISGIAARLTIGFVLLVPLFAFCDEFVGPPAPPTAADEIIVLDKPRDYVSEKFVDFVSSLDRFFGDDRHYQETNDSVLQLDVARVMGYGGEHNFVWSGRANVHLPIAEQKLHLVLETDPDKNAAVDPKQKQSSPLQQPTQPKSYSAALRYMQKEAQLWHFSADGGVKFHGLAATPFVRSRVSMPYAGQVWHSNFAETAFWFNTIGVGETTQLDIERSISEPVLFRATSVATWLHDKQNFDLRQDFSLFHKIDERTAMLYQASAIGVSNPQTEVTEYVVLALYRYRLHREWMYLEVSPQLHFPRALDFHTNSLLSVRLEMLFDDLK